MESPRKEVAVKRPMRPVTILIPKDVYIASKKAALDLDVRFGKFVEMALRKAAKC